MAQAAYKQRREREEWNNHSIERPVRNHSKPRGKTKHAKKGQKGTYYRLMDERRSLRRSLPKEFHQNSNLSKRVEKKRQKKGGKVKRRKSQEEERGNKVFSHEHPIEKADARI